jgi:hypothetical protein
MPTGEHDAKPRTEKSARDGADTAWNAAIAASGAAPVAASDPPPYARRLHQGRGQGRHPAQVSFLAAPFEPEHGVDYRYLYEIVADRAEREEDRGKSLDAKITALLAGIVAFIGFMVRLPLTPLNAGTALVYVVPLAFLLAAFATRPSRIAPTVESLVTFFPRYPATTLRDAVLAMERSCRENVRINDTKNRRLDVATSLTAIATGIILFTQFAAAVR